MFVILLLPPFGGASIKSYQGPKVSRIRIAGKDVAMKAAVVEAIAKPLVVHRDWPDPDCATDEVVIRVEANGICRSDYHIWQGGWPWLGITLAAPFVLGHEYCGVVSVWMRRRRPGGGRHLYGSGSKCDRRLAHRGETGARERTRGRAHGQRIRRHRPRRSWPLGDADTAIPAVLSLRVRGRHLRLGTSSRKQAGTIPLPVDLFVFRELQFIGSFGMRA